MSSLVIGLQALLLLVVCLIFDILTVMPVCMANYDTCILFAFSSDIFCVHFLCTDNMQTNNTNVEVIMPNFLPDVLCLSASGLGTKPSFKSPHCSRVLQGQGKCKRFTQLSCQGGFFSDEPRRVNTELRDQGEYERLALSTHLSATKGKSKTSKYF